jgi:hypothetical protein
MFGRANALAAWVQRHAMIIHVMALHAGIANDVAHEFLRTTFAVAEASFFLSGTPNSDSRVKDVQDKLGARKRRGNAAQVVATDYSGEASSPYEVQS